ncbi:hypothetical protein [Flavobacterium aestuarii]|uniref:hypothetical protein n=1 Tax=Flavobacterium aestuarii TaxID=3149227 RepID=UPI0032B42C30
MKKRKSSKEYNSSKFAFLPENVLEHLNNVKIIEADKTTVKEEIISTSEPKTIIFDPMADPFDGSIIEIKQSLKKAK